MAFGQIDDWAELLFSDGTKLGRVCGAYTAKARNLLLGCYSLALDGLGQESGAIYRVLLEYVEAIRFAAGDPDKNVDRLMSGKTKAGEIAKEIGSTFHGLRKYFNQHVSHASSSREAIGYVIDLGRDAVRPLPGFSENELRTNLLLLVMTSDLLTGELVSVTRQSVAESTRSLMIHRTAVLRELSRRLQERDATVIYGRQGQAVADLTS